MMIRPWGRLVRDVVALATGADKIAGRGAQPYLQMPWNLDRRLLSNAASAVYDHLTQLPAPEPLRTIAPFSACRGGSRHEP